jgi:ribose transport system substrate-binding protein
VFALLLAGSQGCERETPKTPAPSPSTASAAAPAAAPAQPGSAKQLTIAVIPKGTTHVFWKSVEAGAKSAGTELAVNIKWKGPVKEDDRTQQIGIVEQFTAEGIDGIVLAPLDAVALLRPVQAASAKKIPVVIFDSSLNGQQGKDFVSLVATDNRKAGALGGEELARLLGGKGKVVMLRYNQGSASTEQREAGFLDAIAKHPDIQMIEKDRYGGATVGEAQKNAENLLDKLKEADGIFCPNESSTQGMLTVLVANGLATKKKFVGFDTSPALITALKAGQIHALVAQNPTKMGHEAVRTIVAHIRGETVPGYVDTGCSLVTQQNVNDFD